MELSLDQVRHVASLARIALTPEEEKRIQSQLSVILDAVEQLRSVNTDNVEPTSHATFARAFLREDVVESSLDIDKALMNAPAKAGTSFSVPKIIE